MSAVEPRTERGPTAGATREQVVERARAHFLECRRVDVRAIAAECGVGRGTLYRWFGSREQLLGEAMLGVVESRVADARAHVGGRGAAALLDTFDLVYRGLAAAPHVRALIERERDTALAVITSSSGAVHPRMVELTQALIEAEVERGDYRPPTNPRRWPTSWSGWPRGCCSTTRRTTCPRTSSACGRCWRRCSAPEPDREAVSGGRSSAGRARGS